MSNNLEKKTINPALMMEIKTEPGLSSPTRLPSFKRARDLTLGGSKPIAKKIFPPNLNVVRNKNKPVVTSEVFSDRKREVRGGGAGRGANRGAGRGSNILRATGVFSEGVAAGVRHPSSRGYAGDRAGAGGGGGGGDGGGALAKPTLKVKNEWMVDKETEEQQIKELMNNDDEIDTLTDTPLPPTRLPINTFGSLSISKPGIIAKPPPLIKQEVDIKPEPMDDSQITENLPTKMEMKVKLENANTTREATNLLQSEKPTLLLLQFPDSFPGRGPDEEPVDKDKKTDGAETDKKTTHPPCTARHLPEGQIGKICIYKSGKIKLLIGGTFYDLALGTHTCFRQDVMSVSVNSEERSGTMINLGCIRSKLTATPDWERMFQEMEAK